MSHSSGLQIPPSCPFSLGELFFTGLEAHLPWDQTRDASVTRQVGCRGAGDVPVGVCVAAHVGMNTCFIMKPWKSATFTWHGEIVTSALCSSSWPGGACLPRDKHHFTSAGDHIPKTGCFSKHGRYCESFKSLDTPVAFCLISSVLYLLFECEGVIVMLDILTLQFSSILVVPFFPSKFAKAVRIPGFNGLNCSAT